MLITKLNCVRHAGFRLAGYAEPTQGRVGAKHAGQPAIDRALKKSWQV